MKMLRILQSAMLALVLAMSLGVVATTAPADAAKLPKREITLERTQKNWRAFQLRGEVQNWRNKRVIIQKKACPKCKWKKVRTVKANKNSVFRTRILAPKRPGKKWRWRVVVRKHGKFARTRSLPIVLWLR